MKHFYSFNKDYQGNSNSKFESKALIEYFSREND